MKKVFVTGGSGFLGRNLIEQLRKDNVSVVALARSEKAAEAVQKMGAEPAIGDLNNLDALRKGMEGCDTVFHLAAKVELDGTLEEHMKITYEGTCNVLKAATEEPSCKTLVHCSTESVLLGEKPLINADETFPYPKNTVGLYGHTKKLAEIAVIKGNCPDLRTVVIRPRLIWGKGDTVLIPAFEQAYKTGQWKWIAGGDHLTSTTHVRNVCEGLVLGAEKGRGGEIYFVLDQQNPISLKTFITDMMKSSRSLDFSQCSSVPVWLATIGSWLGMLPSSAIKLFGEECSLNDTKARKELGYVGHVSREEGLKELQESNNQNKNEE